MCDCIENTNKALLQAGINGRIMLPLLGPQKPSIMMEKLDEKKRGRAPIFFASYCPLCGEKYPAHDDMRICVAESKPA